MIKNISILGSTGSVGLQTLDLVSLHPDKFRVLGLAAGSNLKVLAQQIVNFSPELVSVKTEAEAKELAALLKNSSTQIVFGIAGAEQVASLAGVNTVVSAIVGAAGLLPTLAALKKGKTVALANKESMVIAGELMRKTASDGKATILPVDSEHSALFQCLEGQRREDVYKLILTASGGPFLKKPLNEFATITVAQALKHPNWNMGAKISIDSATMMNKGLEVMEARWLFDFAVDKIDVCIHPQSIVHSMVEYTDGAIIAQMGVPDMRGPIAYALSYPERIVTGAGRLNLFAEKELTFYAPDFERFPSLQLAFDVAKKGRTYPAVLNAANEIAVAAFLQEDIAFMQIPVLIDKTLQAHDPRNINELADILAVDRWAREYTQTLLKKVA